MLFSIIMGLALFAVICYLIILFFQVHRVERQITDLIQIVEVHLLNKYGHSPNRTVRLIDVKKTLSDDE